jgi:hypothetical protein
VYRYISRWVLWAILAYIVGSGCAAGGQLTGGPKDVSPPLLNEELSPLGQKTNFIPSKLEFFFDEFVQVKDPAKQVLVSPPLTYIPKVRERGKKVIFEFDTKEVLRNDATYTINFGESIVDFREGNKLTNFTYVFSTGDYIDSLSLKGQIINALTNKGDEDIVVFLYDNTHDSIVRSEKPLYFAKPDKNGFFEFRNIKSDTFKIFAISDKNLNYKYDLENEKIAFPDSLYFLDTSFQKSITLRSSLPVPELKKLTHETRTYGQAIIQYNTPIKSAFPVTLSDSTVIFSTDIQNDSLIVYYETKSDSFQLYLPGDTLQIKPGNKTKFTRENPLKPISRSHKDKIVPFDSLVIHFNFPVWNMNSDLITVSDAIGPLDEKDFYLSTNKKSLIFKTPWKAGEEYEIFVDSAALESIHGQVNDSLKFSLEALTKDKTASLLITIKELDTLSSYIFSILSGKNVVFTDRIENLDSIYYKVENLLPLQYDFEIFEDLNKNGLWDPGNYDLKRQPEYYVRIMGGKIRENRDTDVEILWKSQITGIENQQERPELNPLSPNNK